MGIAVFIAATTLVNSRFILRIKGQSSIATGLSIKAKHSDYYPDNSEFGKLKGIAQNQATDNRNVPKF